MPYKDNGSLPDDVKKVLPDKAQNIFREAFNSALDKKQDEAVCNKVAWAAVKGKFEKAGDKWAEKKVNEFEAEIFSAGKWNDEIYTIEDIDDMVQNFSRLKESVKPPLKLGHNSGINDGQPALGWVSSLKRSGEKLIAKFIDVPGIVMKALKNQSYKRVSAEIFWDYKHDNKVFKRVLSAVALLGADVPAVSNLEDVAVYLNTHKGKTKIYTYDMKEDSNNMNDEFKTYKEKTDAEMDKLNGDLKKYKKENADLVQAGLKVKKDNQVAGLKTFCEDLVKKGSMLPAQRDLLTGDNIKHTYTATGDMILSVDIIKKCFELSGIILEKVEKGKQGKTNSKTYDDASQELDNEARKYMKDNPKVSYIDATTHVLDNNDELAERYLEGEHESV